MVYMGTVVEEGKGKAVITATGSLTEIGRIAQMLKEVEEERTPYQRKIDSFSKILGGIIIFLSFLIFIFGVLEGRDFIEMFTTAVAIVTPFTYVAPPPDTAALACENRCMARHHDCGIVRGGRCFCTVDGLFRKARRWP